jgi:NAD(P)H-hydrate epimerase
MQRLARQLEAVVVLKTHVSYIVSPERKISVLDGMNPALATGGSGDVLAGIVGALLARGLTPEHAAQAGVLMHVLLGRETYAENGWFLAEDLLPRVSELISRYQRIL